ncbi:hypothetical protein [Mycobacterium colombiense]|uniref:hypothetical protein n=1 Tax=Mycobacterium colombiense TaxID=339268 RepID=UPI0009E1A9C2|nr:hypothetical protein [Mycobacterium colombiense]
MGKQKNVLGLIALSLSIIGFIFACIPGALIVGWVLLPIAFVLGIVGLFPSGKAKGATIAAVIVSVVGTVVGVTVFFTVVGNAFGNAFHKSDFSPSSPTASSGGGSGPIPQSSSKGSRENPLPIGETVSNEDWQVTLGPPREAGAEIAATNQFNDPPKAGMEYWIVPVTATYTGDKTGNPTFGVTVKFVGSDNRTYDGYCGVIPDPVSDVGDLYKGGVAKGNKCVAVPAGATGLWSVSTGFGGKPIFFAAR